MYKTTDDVPGYVLAKRRFSWSFSQRFGRLSVSNVNTTVVKHEVSGPIVVFSIWVLVLFDLDLLFLLRTFLTWCGETAPEPNRNDSGCFRRKQRDLP